MNNKSKGISMALIAAILWGISGNFAEYIFTHSDITDLSYTTFRMLFSGIILLIYGIFFNSFSEFKKLIFDKKIMLKLVIYSFLGIMGLQYTFSKTVLLSNAPLATLLQFLSPLIILVYISIENRIKPKLSEVILTLISLFGMFLMITNGNLNDLVVNPYGILFGIISACFYAYNVIYIKEFKKYHISLILGIGMILGSIYLLPFNDSNMREYMKPNILFTFTSNVILGNVIPFYLFLESTKYISPKITSLLGAFEPISALIIGVLFMKTKIYTIQIIGGLIIIVSVSLLSFKKE